jgi:hypothetical protein
MPRTPVGVPPRHGEAATALPEALMTMTMHMVESRLALMGELSRCTSPAEAGAVMQHWWEHRLAEFSEDQARLTSAMVAGFADAAAAATEAVEAANGLAQAGIAAQRNGRGGH